jgi:hemerythrin-like metal-binding protein
MLTSQLQQCRLGIDYIDDEHFRLLEELHNLIELVRSGEPYEDAVNSLKRNIRAHFDREDALMTELKYPYINAHLRDHHNLLELVDKFSTQVRIGNSLAYATIVVENIFADHITNFDSQYVDFMRRKQHQHDV